ncbi:MAG: hypothetical protein FJ035_05750 [Chloroflexi bacterium]|nr:hypothetical protein [Chloroflexota bacterium]
MPAGDTLALLVGADDGLWALVPGERARRVLEAGPVVALDARAGVVACAVEGQGLWVRRGRGAFERRWEGDARAVRIAEDGQLFVGAAPPAVFADEPDGGFVEWPALQSVLRYTRTRTRASGGSAVSGFVRAGSHLLVAVAGLGTFLTLDDSRSWAAIGDGLDPEITALCEHPERPHRRYAACASGVYRSEDGGYTWVQSLHGLDRSVAWQVVVQAGVPDVLLLAASRRADGSGGALFRSPDGGTSFERVRLGDRDEWDHPPAVASLAGDELAALFAVAGGGAWGSHDGGARWLPLADDAPRAARALVASIGAW